MDRQHSLTTRFVSMVSVMNIHGRRFVPLVNTLDDLYQAMVLDSPSRHIEFRASSRAGSKQITSQSEFAVFLFL